MRLPEEAARHRWCPFARAGSGGVNRFSGIDTGKPHTDAKCLGSGCMAWRWVETNAAVPTSGYCGLAGQP